MERRKEVECKTGEIMFGKKKIKKILKVEYPILTTYPHIANVLAMYENNPYIATLVMSELIELTFDKEIDRLDFSVALEIEHYIKTYPMLYSHNLSRSFIQSKWKSAVEFVKDAIDDNSFVHMLVDTFYIKNYEGTYASQHFYHNPMIYGYDDYEEVFYVADCFVNGKYEFAKVSFNEIENAFIHQYSGDWLNGVWLFKVKEEPYIGIGYNTDYIKKACKRYLNNETATVSTYLEGRRRYDMQDRFVDGIQVYDEIVKYIEDDVESEEKWRGYDVRIFYLLCDHAKLFRYITKQLMQRNQIVNAPYIYDAFFDIENRIKSLYMQVLKYNVTGSDRIKNDIKAKLLDIKNLEATAINMFCENIDVTKEDISKERPHLVLPIEVVADSIFVEYDDEANWKRKSVSDRQMYTENYGSYILTQFSGSSAKIYIMKNTAYGKAKVSVDGVEKRVIDYSDSTGENMIEFNDLSEGYHYLKLENISENGKQINVRKFEFGESSLTENVCEIIDYKRGCDGNQIMKYGKAGFDIVCAKRNLPEYLTNANYVIHNVINVLLITNNADRRGVKRYKSDDERIAAYALSDTEFWYELTIPGEGHEISFYCSDYDNLGRCMKLVVLDADNGEVLCSRVIEDFNEGVFVRLFAKGHISLKFVNLHGPDAVVNGFWFE